MENQNRVAKIVLLVAGIALVLCLGMAIGGAIVYGVMQVADVKPSLKLDTFGFQFGDQPRQRSVEVVTSGAAVVEVTPGSPAESAGLQVGDIIVSVDRQELSQQEDLASLIAEYEPGDRLSLQIERPGEGSKTVQVNLGEHPDKAGVAYLGIKYSTPSSFQVPVPGTLPFTLPRGRTVQGVVVSGVVEDSPAASAGLQQGDAITTLDGETIESPRALTAAIAERKPGDRVTLGVVRPGQQDELEIAVVLGQDPEQSDKAYLGVRIGGRFRYYIAPGFRGGQGSPDLQFRDGRFFFNWPDTPSLDELPFNLNDLPFDWKEFQGSPSEGDSL
jgi:S1-C subfamily serine protease